MTLTLDRMPPFQTQHRDFPAFNSAYNGWYNGFRAWWQKSAKAIEDQEAVQDALIASLEATDDTVALALADLEQAQNDLAATQADLEQTIEDLAGTQSDLDDAENSVASLDARLDLVELPAVYNDTAINLRSGKVLQVNGTQVISAQGAAIADASTSASNPPTQAEVNAIATKVNDILARLRAHGIIAT